MSLRVWLPLTKDLRQQGLDNVTITNNGATFNSAGKLGGCYSFDGVDDRISCSSYTCTYPMSISAWFKPTDVTNTNTQYWLSYNTASGGTAGHAIGIGLYGAKLSIWYGGQVRSLSTAITNNVWYHIAVTIDANKKVITYLNGTQIDTVTFTSNNPGSTWLTLGARSNSSTGGVGGALYFYKGYMNDARLYNHCLSPMEVKELAKGLVLHYPLNRQGWGQENLYTGSRDFSGTWVNGSAWTTSTETYEGFTVKERSATWGGLAQNVTATNGDIFTISFYAKVASGGRIVSIHRSNLGNVTTGLSILGGNFIAGTTDWVGTTTDGTQWNRYWATVQIVSSDITYLQWRIENSVADKKLQVCGMKLEKGSVPTPWCPNSSDTLATTMGLNGTTEYDCSGFCNNGTRTGTLTWTSDTPKYAVSTNFAAVGTIINNTSPIHLSNEFTIAWWGKINSWKKNWEGMFLLQNNATLNAGTNTYDIMSALHASTANSMSLTICQNGSSYAFDKYKWTYTIGVWAHYTCTYKAGVITIYQNGISIYTETITDNSSNNYYYRLGHRANFCDCQISDFRIYATALSADDVKSLYQNCATIDPDGTIRGQIRS